MSVAGRLAWVARRRREDLRALLRPSERVTRRGRGSEYPRTFEDAAREIWARGGKRAPAIGFALQEYQNALHAIWTHAIEVGAVRYAADFWISSRGFPASRRDEVIAEATWLARDQVWRHVPGRSTLATHLTKVLEPHLDRWARSDRLPLHVPDNVGTGEDGSGTTQAYHRRGLRRDDRGVGVSGDREGPGRSVLPVGG